jgi:hypothetical protein
MNPLRINGVCRYHIDYLGCFTLILKISHIPFPHILMMFHNSGVYVDNLSDIRDRRDDERLGHAALLDGHPHAIRVVYDI